VGTSLPAADRQRLIARAGVITIVINIALTAVRVMAGLLSGSTAVLADAANSGTDILATLVVLGGTRIAAKPPDPDHPYGHEKAEPVAAKLVGILVTFTGVVAAVGSWRALGAGAEQRVGLMAAVVAGGAIFVKAGLSRYLMGIARRFNNQALAADAANQRTDVLASGAALIGALGGRFGVPLLDPAMGLLVAGLILRMGIGLYWRSLNELMDPAPDPETMAHLERATASVAGVLSVDEVKARVFGSGIYVDCKVCVDGQMTVEQGHAIAGRVRAKVKAAIGSVRDVLVHINPCDPPEHLDYLPEGTILVPGSYAEMGQHLDKS
jgi:cation diffusion facilitator family transporter